MRACVRACMLGRVCACGCAHASACMTTCVRTRTHTLASVRASERASLRVGKRARACVRGSVRAHLAEGAVVLLVGLPVLGHGCRRPQRPAHRGTRAHTNTRARPRAARGASRRSSSGERAPSSVPRRAGRGGEARVAGRCVARAVWRDACVVRPRVPARSAGARQWRSRARERVRACVQARARVRAHTHTQATHWHTHARHGQEWMSPCALPGTCPRSRSRTLPDALWRIRRRTRGHTHTHTHTRTQQRRTCTRAHTHTPAPRPSLPRSLALSCQTAPYVRTRRCAR